MPSLKQFLFGQNDRVQQTPRYTQDQQAQLGQLMQGVMPGLQGGLGYLSDLYSNDPAAMQRMQQPYLDQFNQQIVPGLAERFSSMGGQNSSAFRNAMLGAAGNLETQLAGQREGLRSQNLGSLANFFGMGMTPQFDTQIMQGNQGFLSSLAGNLPLLLQYTTPQGWAQFANGLMGFGGQQQPRGV